MCTAHLGTVGVPSGLDGTPGTGREGREGGVGFAPEDGRGGGGCLLPLEKEKQLQVHWKCSYKYYKSKSQTCNLWCTTVVARIKWDQDTSCQILPINHFASLLSRSNKKHNNNNKKGAYTHIKKTDFFPPLWEISVRSNSPGTNLGGEGIRAGSGTWQCLVEKWIFCNVPKLVR